MLHITRSKLYVLLLTVLLLPKPATAIPAITCHCFTERKFNSERPSDADPYFLATTQNSFFAEIFHVDKKSIVLKKQSGVSSDDLWIAYWIASKMRLPAEKLLQTKEEKGSWKDAIKAHHISTATLGHQFSKVLNSMQFTKPLAEAVLDELILQNQLLDAGELTTIRKSGASNQELIISILICGKTRQPARELYQRVKSGKETWGSMFTTAGIDSRNLQHEVSALLKLKTTVQ